jgi:hypothetical protein
VKTVEVVVNDLREELQVRNKTQVVEKTKNDKEEGDKKKVDEEREELKKKVEI